MPSAFNEIRNPICLPLRREMEEDESIFYDIKPTPSRTTESSDLESVENV